MDSVEKSWKAYHITLWANKILIRFTFTYIEFINNWFFWNINSSFKLSYLQFFIQISSI